MKNVLIFCVLSVVYLRVSGHASCDFRTRILESFKTVLEGQLDTCLVEKATPPPAPTYGDGPPVRLVNGPRENAGILQIFHDDQWGTVCENEFYAANAVVVCRSLGFKSPRQRSHHHIPYGEGTGPIWLDDVECRGDETSIEQCFSNEWGVQDCEHENDISVDCFLPSIEIRLVNGENGREGRVEVEIDGNWGTVCDDNFDDADAAVVCYMMGYSRAGAKAVHTSEFGESSTRGYYGDLNCTGDELSIEECTSKPATETCCLHDAAVICQAVPIRLVGGDKDGEGVVEIQYGGEWGSICGYSFSNKEASVLCHMLGYSRTGAVGQGYGHYGEGSGPVYLDELVCTGEEDSIFQCISFPIGDVDESCTHDNDAGITCQTD